MTTITADIRFAETTDADCLARVHAEAWREAYAGIVPYRALDAMIRRRHAGWWTRTLKAGAGILVCEYAGQVIGYATLGRNRTRALDVESEIYELYLEPSFQGLGFGGRLFKAAREILNRDGSEGLVVWALADNHRALAFYHAMGGKDLAEGRETFDGQELAKIAFLWS
ncbi:MAG: GNAT family N-acetyltransferase [Fulvimarina manganoxydans]|uniref:GNAT family N-acetyltransferase n=1 Tax=Fulvimarina manganoxydans TaxID=937218 RepID=UPI0023528EC1|nr:GNAT family N-acetyltransferase [Fulvimarina manganoxydans]MCK5932366.1 GNAT family N-acetyltransferase [Fulvimarina manganoxydans]